MTRSAAVYTVEAYNLSQTSENKIHDDTVAQKLGFTGGLVPGVEVFAYMTHPAVVRWGRDWLECGRMQGGFKKPVYDGRIACVTASENADGGLAMACESDGVDCASATALMQPPTHPIAPADYAMRLPPATRPPADENSLAVGNILCTKPAVLTPERHQKYLRDVRETLPIYAQEGIAHPGLLLRLCNSCLVENVVLSPWIHTASALQNYSVARIGEEISARARVVRNWEHKGHRSVELDCAVIADDRVVAHVTHTAIYKLRHLSG
jgi:hypothetical protein